MIGPAPTVPIWPRPPLSIAQARWFTEREVHRFVLRATFKEGCWRLLPMTVACPYRYEGRREVELVELDTVADQYVRVTLALHPFKGKEWIIQKKLTD